MVGTDRMGSGEEEREARSEAAFTDSADGSSSSSDAASADEWPVTLAAPPRKTAACGRVPGAEVVDSSKPHAQKRRAPSSGTGTTEQCARSSSPWSGCAAY